jgi:hypothetical protein
MGAFRLVSVIAASGMLGSAVLTGCTSYTNVPGPDGLSAQQDPNARQASRATEAALVWATRRHAPQGPYVINLPVGTSLETAETIAAALGPMAQIPGSAEVDLPVFHVTRVWIRLSDAKVDVVYPMTDGLGRDIQRGVTVWMNAGVRPWTPSRGQYWAPGTVPVPPIWVPIPQAELDAIAEAEKQIARDAKRAAEDAERPEPRAPEPEAPPAEDPGEEPTFIELDDPGAGD